MNSRSVASMTIGGCGGLTTITGFAAIAISEGSIVTTGNSAGSTAIADSTAMTVASVVRGAASAGTDAGSVAMTAGSMDPSVRSPAVGATNSTLRATAVVTM